MGGIKLSIFTFPDAVIGFFMAPIIPIIHKIKNFPPKQIIHPMSGFLKPGEMCMVLGRPNSGCSTLLKVLANQREGFVRVNGNVSYGGILADLMAKQCLASVIPKIHEGEGIYEQFNKVIVLNEGRMVYFGPAKEAQAYMVSLGYKNLPQQTTANYLTGFTDPNEQQFQNGIYPTQVPKSPEDMERAYKNSKIFQREKKMSVLITRNLSIKSFVFNKILWKL
ncbi:hypothetical protein PPACK8108_LOCUS21955 [Phakopsora pachyrhizi]|uniref:ABC transporter domain-containing protein n=1 Tax=Phakopsora pachyrhizi TaxID=170000 RepID=A0AAV0BJQ6_PHAPC|nr:hypothetical protein PPACK8108_LOCUS21955 [Phakopsora pachyrhizi]